MARIRKALAAGVLAALTALLSAWVAAGRVQWGEVGTAVGAGITAGLAVYGIRNAGTIEGSDPPRPPPPIRPAPVHRVDLPEQDDVGLDLWQPENGPLRAAESQDPPVPG